MGGQDILKRKNHKKKKIQQKENLQKKRKVNAVSNLPNSEKWKEAKDPNTGRSYWWNIISRDTTWKDPYVSKWQKAYSDIQKRPYWGNTETHETTWENPKTSKNIRTSGILKEKLVSKFSSETATLFKDDRSKELHKNEQILQGHRRDIPTQPGIYKLHGGTLLNGQSLQKNIKKNIVESRKIKKNKKKMAIHEQWKQHKDAVMDDGKEKNVDLEKQKPS